VSRERDVQAFDDRAESYETDWRGKMHLDIVTRSLDLALAADATPSRVLDVGSGTGMLLRLLANRLPVRGQELLGIDAAAGMVDVARAAADDPRLGFLLGVAEHLPFVDGYFDLVVSTTSFDHWADQAAGIRECFRVLVPDGHLVLTDLMSPVLLPTTVLGRRGRARTKRRAGALLTSAGFGAVTWHRLYRGIIATAVASKGPPDPERRRRPDASL
jgi:ubiquinone/menaquinone biosynthesis C-methylase UbiE